MIEIITNLWIGDYNDSKNITELNKHNINVIINCTKNLPHNKSKFKFIRIPIDKLSTYPEKNKFILNSLNKLLPIIHEHINSFSGVLLFCDDMTISATYLICYFIYYLKTSSDKIIKFLNYKNNTIKYTEYLSCVKSFENIVLS